MMARILIVDDNPYVQQTLAQLLAMLGHEVVRAGDGRQALAHLRRERCDAVLTDVLMPEIDGLEVLRCVARDHPGLPVIAMSGGSARMPSTDVLQLAHSLGAHAILAKPFGAAELRETLAAVLR
jgi:CheY-like chemotaxis protein